ncbi:MAG: glycoside hydrolase family 3 domain protein, partial [Actinotalea sp.]|nr:glycoside hydrolase family 3 domain protein [Actinotalea sp.]
AVYRGSSEVATSTSEPDRYVVSRAAPRVSTSGTDWSVRRSDPKVVEAQVAGVAGVTPTGTVTVAVLGGPTVTGVLRPDGTASVGLPSSVRTSLVLVGYGGDGTYTGALALPRLLVVRP